VSTRTNLNIPEDVENFNVLGSISKTFNKIETRIFGSYTFFKGFQFFGADQNQIQTNVYSVRPRIRTNFTKAPNFSVGYNVTWNNQDNTNVRTNAVNEFATVTTAPRIEFDAYLWDSLTIKSDFTYNEVKQNGTLQNLFKIWNFTMAYRKNRDAKWEYELVGSNLLGTDSRVNVNLSNIANSINETFILPRFISFRMRYQL
jgi:hypothetical protein